MQIPTTEEIFSGMEMYIRANHPLLTNFEPTSALSTICEAVAIQIYQMYQEIDYESKRISILTATGTDLDMLVLDRLPAGRLPGTRAQGFLTFSRNSVALTDTVIPTGTLTNAITDEITTTKLQTISTGIIAAGTVSCIVPAQATEPGIIGNVSSYTVTSLANRILGVDGVTNTSPFTGGTDAETDAELSRRYRSISQITGTATDPIITQHLTDLESVWEAQVYNHGYGDIEVVVDYDKTGTQSEIDSTEDEISTALLNNISAGIVSRGALSATVNTGTTEPLLTVCEGGHVWIRPRDNIISSDQIIIHYADKTTGTVKVTAFTVPAMSLRGDAVLVTDDIATSIPEVIYNGDKSYDILLGYGTYPHLFIGPRIVPLIVTINILTTDTPSVTLATDIQSSVTAFLDGYMIGDSLQYSDMYSPIFAHQAGGIDALLDLRVSGADQAMDRNGQVITILGDQRIETGLVNITLTSP